eukprot:13975362-Alexandrium_andersonii.AAC.1
MSASLVGSEMCIRDSLRCPRRQACTGLGLGAWLPGPSSCTKRPRDSPGTVSYTHLTLPTICSV